MTFTGRTPEALLPRSDSKNPATTCKGITSSGRPCRRALAVSLKTCSTALLNQKNTAAFYCWQHKDQAEHLAAREQTTTLYPLVEKSSIDTLIERVGVLDLDKDDPRRPKKNRRRHENDEQRPRQRSSLPSGGNEMESPLMTAPEDMVRRRRVHVSQNKYGQSNVKASWSCCIRADDDDGTLPARPHTGGLPPPAQSHASNHGHTAKRSDPSHSSSGRRISRSTFHATSAQLSRPSPLPTPSSSSSQTQTLLSLIPTHISPQTTSLLLAELSRPISSADEAGYIYIFWLTPEGSPSKPDDETASLLLDELDTTSQARSQRTTEALQRYSSTRHADQQHFNRQQHQTSRTITLKIGRAANVHRRMSQWSKQCGQNITLIRYYPYFSQTHGASSNHNQESYSSTNSSSSSNDHPDSTTPPATPRKVPHVHRVERLIHIELGAMRTPAKEPCIQCGREHREWFEVEASRRGLRTVDEVVRRWVGWAERQNQRQEQSQ